MDHASASFTSPWAAAVLSQHAMNPTNIEHGFGHHGLTMDYSYYRCEELNIIFCHVFLLFFFHSLLHSFVKVKISIRINIKNELNSRALLL